MKFESLEVSAYESSVSEYAKPLRRIVVLAGFVALGYFGSHENLEARELPSEDVSIQKSFDVFAAKEKDSVIHGWMELPDGRHGITVPGSEHEVGEKILHTEVRRTWSDKEGSADIITVWEVDQEGDVDGDPEVYEKDSTVYARYRPIADKLAEELEGQE